MEIINYSEIKKIINYYSDLAYSKKAKEWINSKTFLKYLMNEKFMTKINKTELSDNDLQEYDENIRQKIKRKILHKFDKTTFFTQGFDIQYILDWLNTAKFNDSFQISKMNVKDAFQKAIDYHDKIYNENSYPENQKNQYISDNVLDVDIPGKVWVKLEQEHLISEGNNMKHCVGQYDTSRYQIYSLRDDKQENSFVTVSISNDNKLEQIKGKENTIPFEYRYQILKFLENLNKINILETDFSSDFQKLGFNNKNGIIFLDDMKTEEKHGFEICSFGDTSYIYHENSLLIEISHGYYTLQNVPLKKIDKLKEAKNLFCQGIRKKRLFEFEYLYHNIDDIQKHNDIYYAINFDKYEKRGNLILLDDTVGNKLVHGSFYWNPDYERDVYIDKYNFCFSNLICFFDSEQKSYSKNDVKKVEKTINFLNLIFKNSSIHFKNKDKFLFDHFFYFQGKHKKNFSQNKLIKCDIDKREFSSWCLSQKKQSELSNGAWHETEDKVVFTENKTNKIICSIEKQGSQIKEIKFNSFKWIPDLIEKLKPYKGFGLSPISINISGLNHFNDGKYNYNDDYYLVYTNKWIIYDKKCSFPVLEDRIVKNCWKTVLKFVPKEHSNYTLAKIYELNTLQIHDIVKINVEEYNEQFKIAFKNKILEFSNMKFFRKNIIENIDFSKNFFEIIHKNPEIFDKDTKFSILQNIFSQKNGLHTNYENINLLIENNYSDELLNLMRQNFSFRWLAEKSVTHKQKFEEFLETNQNKYR